MTPITVFPIFLSFLSLSLLSWSVVEADPVECEVDFATGYALCNGTSLCLGNMRNHTTNTAIFSGPGMDNDGYMYYYSPVELANDADIFYGPCQGSTKGNIALQASPNACYTIATTASQVWTYDAPTLTITANTTGNNNR